MSFDGQAVSDIQKQNMFDVISFEKYIRPYLAPESEDSTGHLIVKEFNLGQVCRHVY